MKYVTIHQTIVDYNAVKDNLDKPQVAVIIENNSIEYQPYIPHDYSQDYLTIVSLEDNNTISFSVSDASIAKTIFVSTDNGYTWAQKTSDKTAVALATLNTGDKLLIKGSNAAYGDSSFFNYFISTANFNVEGNIMSLIYGDNFIGQTTLDSSGYNFKHLFYNCNKLISAENLSLPATTLVTGCYSDMFYKCSSLITAPNLPATTVATHCYNEMFRNCTSLTTIPSILPATTLANYCYTLMFYNCTSLTTAPELPATTLTYYCYGYMFNGCTSLNYVKCLATDISASNCTYCWLSNVASSGTFVKASNMSSWGSGASGIPSGWTVQDAA